MNRINVVFRDGRKMTVEPGVTFTGTDSYTGASVKYICFTDHRTTGPFFAKRKYMYYFKIASNSGRIIYSDDDSADEFDFVTETLARALNCSKKGALSLFELVRGGVRSVTIL